MKNFYNTNNQELESWFHSFAAKTLIDCSLCLCKSPSFFIDLTLQPNLKANFRLPMCLYHVYGTNCEVKIKELLWNFWHYNVMIGGRKIRNFCK